MNRWVGLKRWKVDFSNLAKFMSLMAKRELFFVFFEIFIVRFLINMIAGGWDWTHQFESRRGGQSVPRGSQQRGRQDTRRQTCWSQDYGKFLKSSGKINSLEKMNLLIEVGIFL